MERSQKELMSILYDELKALAQAQMRSERSNHTLGPTALVHEAYTKLATLDLAGTDRLHFLRLAARVMRQVLVDYARARRSAKRGAGAVRVVLDDAQPVSRENRDALDLDGALKRLEQLDARQSQLVELHYFGGLSYAEIAASLKISPATVGRELRFARAWLRRELCHVE